MGFAFAIGVLARLMQRRRQNERGVSLDVLALLAATVIPILMTRLWAPDGVIQRIMFLVAYLWYGREALLLHHHAR
jgi:hypothetical protein